MLSAEYSCKLFKPIFFFFTNRQTVWTLIRQQSDLGPHCLQKLPLKMTKQTTIVVIGSLKVSSGLLIEGLVGAASMWLSCLAALKIWKLNWKKDCQSRILQWSRTLRIQFVHIMIFYSQKKIDITCKFILKYCLAFQKPRENLPSAYSYSESPEV